MDKANCLFCKCEIVLEYPSSERLCDKCRAILDEVDECRERGGIPQFGASGVQCNDVS